MLKTYFDPYATDNPALIPTMLTAAAKDSPTYPCALHQIGETNAYSEDMQKSRPLTATKGTVTVTLISALDASGGGFHAMWTATDTSTAVKDEQDGHNGVKATGYLNPDGAQVAVENTPTELDPAPEKTLLAIPG